MSEPAPIKDLLNPIAAAIKPLGFKKVGNRKWYRSNDEIEQLILLDRYRFEPKHHLHLLGNILRFQRGTTYGHEGFHTESLAQALIPDQEEFSRALDQESGMSAESRASVFNKAFTDHLVPFLQRTSTEEGIISCFLELKNLRMCSICCSTMRALHLTPQERGW